MASVLDLKNPKNHKKNNSRSVGDVLNGDSAMESEPEPTPMEPAKDFLSAESADILPPSFGIDKKEEILNNPSDMAPFSTFASLSWIAPDKHHELISHAWRKGVIIVLVAAAFLALFWQGSILTATTFFALALATSMHFWREAKYEKYEIHPHGIVAGGEFHHYHDLDSFCIHYNSEGRHELSLCTGKLLNHYVKIPLNNQNPFEIRDALAAYLPEKKHEEGFEDLLRRKLGL